MTSRESRFRFLADGLVTCLMLFCSAAAYAAGFYFSEVGTPTSLGTAGAANATNNWGADASWADPAGLTGAKGTVAMAGLMVKRVDGKLDGATWEAVLSPRGSVRWIDRSGDKPVILTKEPGTTWGKRFKVRMMRILPGKKQL